MRNIDNKILNLVYKLLLDCSVERSSIYILLNNQIYSLALLSLDAIEAEFKLKELKSNKLVINKLQENNYKKIIKNDFNLFLEKSKNNSFYTNIELYQSSIYSDEISENILKKIYILLKKVSEKKKYSLEIYINDKKIDLDFLKANKKLNSFLDFKNVIDNNQNPNQEFTDIKTSTIFKKLDIINSYLNTNKSRHMLSINKNINESNIYKTINIA